VSGSPCLFKEPTFWRNLTHGYDVGQQSELLFTARFEGILHLTPAQARDALSIRGFRGPSDSRPASRVFGEGRENI
jgi:ubiquinone biosynthesis protein COQ4